MKLLLLLLTLAIFKNCQASNVASCGQNVFGEGGTGTNNQNTVTTAQQVTNFNSSLSINPTIGGTALKIVAGQFFSIMLSDDGSLYSFGRNNRGQLGNGNQVNSPNPVKVLLNVSLSTDKILLFGAAYSTEFAIALVSTIVNGKETHQMWGWGRNDAGYLGLGTQTQQELTPKKVKSNNLQGEIIVALRVGISHTIILTRSNKIYTWGMNDFGQLGDGTVQFKMEPTAVLMTGVLSGKSINDVSATGQHNLVLTADGQVFGWGRNNLGQLGTGVVSPFEILPSITLNTKLNSLVKAIATGEFHSIAWNIYNQAYGWGSNSFGETGNRSTDSPVSQGPTESIAINQMISREGENPIKTVCGNQNTFILTSAGNLWVYGNNQNGQLGLGTTNTQILGTKFRVDVGTGLIGAKRVLDVAAGDAHTIVTYSSSSQTLFSFAIVLLIALSYL